ncbi:uncharacterized protein LOC126904979 [Daktulosphaira vitifoliae]|uniref:uncharacterized protein LOC126904979 n=1 Tax=Daktulosphaira vitifoliae TaxID=58002 RepID=UPI0021AABAFA|nr:uncharacterized protein LOC126904979 [Daktulosphaira vitifoliae]
MNTQTEMKIITNNKCFDGHQKVYEHYSNVVKCNMKFGIYIPPQENEAERFPVLFYLSGLTCTEQNVITKSGFQRIASQYKIIVITPDTSPRKCNIPNEEEKWNVGSGASMYVNATQEPWNKHYQMYTYITEELYQLILNNFPVLNNCVSITGHSMGGHGALLCSLLNPTKFKSVSGFAPVCNISNSPTLREGLITLIGKDEETWKDWDPTHIVTSYNGPKVEILIHVGTADEFLKEDLLIENFVKAASENENIKITVNYEKGYDHSYYFVSSYIEEHIKFHSSILHKYKNLVIVNRNMKLEKKSDVKCFGGYQKIFEHDSDVLNTSIRFSIYIPPNLEDPAPVLYYLSGMSCNEKTFIERSGYQRWASQYGIIVVAPDVCPRIMFSNEKSIIEAKGLSFYIDAVQSPWNKNYNMYSYVNEELPKLIQDNFNIKKNRQSIMGHSMGGHGALISALKNPGKFQSVSAFAPVCNPAGTSSIIEIYNHYFGKDTEAMELWDATCLISNYKGPNLNLLIHQGSKDEYAETLNLEKFSTACRKAGIESSIKVEEGYNHGYHFVSSFIEEHIHHHSKFLL